MESELTPIIKTFGASLLGIYVSTMLYGCICCIAVVYYRRYPSDRAWFKWMVASMWFIDTVHTVLTMHYCYHYLIIHEMDSGARTSAVWSLQSANLLTVFPPFVSNIFYLTRLYKIGQKNVFVIGLIALLIIGRLGLETSVTILGFIHPTFAGIAPYHYLIKAYCSVSSVVDLILGGLITYKLIQVRTASPRSNKTIDLIVLYLVSTGLMTGIVCLSSLFSAIFLRGGLVDVTLHAILGKLYVISVLAVLNSRQSHSCSESTLFEASAFGVDSGISEKGSLRSKFRSNTLVTLAELTPAGPVHHSRRGKRSVRTLSIHIDRVDEVHTSDDFPVEPERA